MLADRDEWGYLLQLFTRSPYQRNTMFYELVQRRGARGFGGANIKALYEAVERDGLAGQVNAGYSPAVGSAILRQEDLHASVSDPVLDTMNFLNEITLPLSKGHLVRPRPPVRRVLR